jgi:hypothetical protein
LRPPTNGLQPSRKLGTNSDIKGVEKFLKTKKLIKSEDLTPTFLAGFLLFENYKRKIVLTEYAKIVWFLLYSPFV